MGTDITLFAEHRSKGGEWSVADDLVPSEIYFPEDPECMGDPSMVPMSIDIPRSSGLFAVLAGIHSGSRRHVPFAPLSSPRGLPPDATEIAKAWHNAWREDAFSASWLSLQEIDEFNWQQVVQNLVLQDGIEVSSYASYAEIAGYSWFRKLLTPYERCRDVRFIFWFDQ